MRKKLTLLLMAVFLMVGYTNAEKLILTDGNNFVLAETDGGTKDNENDSQQDPEPNPNPIPEIPEPEPVPGPIPDPDSERVPEPKPESDSQQNPNPNPNPKPKPSDTKGKGKNTKGTLSPSTKPTSQPIPPPTYRPNPATQVEQESGFESTPDVVESVEELIEEPEEVDEETDDADEEKQSDNDGFLTLAELKETEVMITLENGQYYAIYKDDDDHVVKQPITEFAAIQLGYEKEIVEIEDEQIKSAEFTSVNKNDYFKKMFGMVSAGTIIIGLIMGTYMYYRRKMT